jgi:hypothetical protein
MNKSIIDDLENVSEALLYTRKMIQKALFLLEKATEQGFKDELHINIDFKGGYYYLDNFNFWINRGIKELEIFIEENKRSNNENKRND